MTVPETQTRTQFTRESIIDDYRVAVRSRQASLIGRREVLTGKAKFGIFGDGKEVAQLAWARAFRRGDWRSGYYRDQTFIFAVGAGTLDEFFAQLYADADIERDPWSAGRSMNAHFASRLVAWKNQAGTWENQADAWKNQAETWENQVDAWNIRADVSPTGSQMPALVGLAWASRLYRELGIDAPGFSRRGDEIAWGTIGNASCAEGMFWESLNAAGVIGMPMIVSIWDDGYGISVPNEYQITKGNLSELLKGFQRERNGKQGYDIYTVKAWDYPALCETYIAAATIVRHEHVPAIIHVTEVTQPQGHSTSGSHERYKSKERLEWEVEFDCIRKMREWMIAQGIATAQELDDLEKEDTRLVREAQRRAWAAYRRPIDAELREAVQLLDEMNASDAKNELQKMQSAYRRDIVRAVAGALIANPNERAAAWLRQKQKEGDERYGEHLLSSAPAPAEVRAEYADDAQTLNGFEIINHCFDHALRRDPRIVIFGEDVGKLGDVNQGCLGLQEKYGVWRVMDTGIRECTIVGQAIGAAMRGFRPIAEIQYLDYLLYALQILSDDLATLRWRSAGGQKAPVIIRTRGHRLEGIWHSGSPMAGIINLVRGIHVCVPRNMTQAAGMYNTLLQSEDPAIVVEVLNAYRSKEKLPSNISEMTVSLGVPEVVRAGSDVTVVSYGATLRIVLEAAELLATRGVECEVIDVQTLLPFDTRGVIVESLRKTNRIAFIDEDVPGGATAFMMRNVLERDKGYEWLDSEPRTVPGKDHRPSYGSDGDYWSKPNRETIFAAVYDLMREANPRKYPPIF